MRADFLMAVNGEQEVEGVSVALLVVFDSLAYDFLVEEDFRISSLPFPPVVV